MDHPPKTPLEGKGTDLVRHPPPLAGKHKNAGGERFKPPTAASLKHTPAAIGKPLHITALLLTHWLCCRCYHEKHGEGCNGCGVLLQAMMDGEGREREREHGIYNITLFW